MTGTIDVRYNNALQLTRGASEASGLRRTRLCLVPLAAERECYPGRCGTTRGGLNSIGKPTDSAAHE